MPKRKLTALDSDSTTLTSRSRRQKFSKPAERFIWKPREWRQVRSITSGVTVLAKKENRQLIVIKKVVRTYKDDVDEAGGMPFEVRALNFLPDCNRIAKPLFVSLFDPDSSHSTIFYKHHPLGDLSDWKKNNFDDKNRKTVPESHIWRFFLQIGQALAAIHNELGPSRKDGYALLHRDIKPGNILVVDNGTTYPSFKLNDFDCAMLFDPAKAGRASLVGTFRWQPPENPKICTKAADVWSLGACVHYLATNHAPTEDFLKYKTACLAEDEKIPSSAQDYKSDDRYYQARVPRHVTSINIGEYHYSDELDGWMASCLDFSARRRPKAGKLIEKMWDTATEMLQHFGGKSALVDLDVKFDASA